MAIGSVPRLFTIGEIARKAKVANHRVLYVLQSRGIEPVARAGHYRLFTAEQYFQVVQAIRRPLKRGRKSGRREISRSLVLTGTRAHTPPRWQSSAGD